MRNYVSSEATFDAAPAATVPSGTGFLVGALFGVAIADVPAGQVGAFQSSGIVDIAKTSALAIAQGARVYWVPASNVVNTTATAQQQVGVAVAAAANPSPTVRIRLGAALAVGA